VRPLFSLTSFLNIKVISRKLSLRPRESGCSSGMKLEFYPSNPGSTPARVKTTKKDKKKPPRVPLMTAEL